MEVVFHRMRYCRSLLSSVVVFCIGLFSAPPLFAAPLPQEHPLYAASIFPIRAILEEIVAGRGEVIGIIPPGGSPHTFELRPGDVKKISVATTLFFAAESLDGWSKGGFDTKRLELFSLLPAPFRLRFDDGSIDPHFWLDPVAVQGLLPGLISVLCKGDPDGCTIYQNNGRTFHEKLTALDRSVRRLLAAKKGGIILFHPSFLYFFKRYSLTFAGAVETSPGREASPHHLARLIRNAKEGGAVVILSEPQLPERSARALAEACALPLLMVDPVGGTQKTGTYEALILHNARLISGALR